ncbi:MAG: nucleotidyltransferase [Acidobacteriota bacterium]|nr:nucleotidyltransferase [Acidobacteriota bacterium]
MTGQEETLAALARCLTELEIPYMVIGGHANAVWGEPRSTLDIDLTIWLSESRIGELVVGLSEVASPRVSDPATFVSDTRVLPLATPEGLAVDVIFGLLPFEEEAIRRARVLEVGEQQVRFCTAEDLILLKIASLRDRDLADVRGVAKRQRDRLDLDYLEPRIEELANLLDRPEIATFWKAAKSQE